MMKVLGKGVRRTGRGYNNMDNFFLAPLYPLSNIKITKYFNYEPGFNGIYSRDDLLGIKDGEYVKNIDDKQSKGNQMTMKRMIR